MELIKGDSMEEILKQVLFDNYNLIVKQIVKNEESTDGNVYIIETVDKKFVVKIYKNKKHTDSMIRLHKHLFNNDFYVPKIIKNHNNKNYVELKNNIVVVYSFLDGQQLSNLELYSKDIIKKLAKELKRFHDITNNNIYELNEISNNLENLKRKSALHFDLTKHNIFYNNGKIGFIDFDDAKFGPSVYDVAITSALLFFSKKRGLDENNLELFIESYYENNKNLKEKEFPLIKKIAINWVNYILDNNEFDSSLKESFNIKKELLESSNYLL